MYLISGTYYSDLGKSNAMKLFIIFTSNSRTETTSTVSDKWQEFCVHW